MLNGNTWSQDRVKIDEQNTGMPSPYLQSTESDFTVREPETKDRAGLPVIDVDVLISGAGPAGESLGCFLASLDEFKSSLTGYKLWWNT